MNVNLKKGFTIWTYRLCNTHFFTSTNVQFLIKCQICWRKKQVLNSEASGILIDIELGNFLPFTLQLYCISLWSPIFFIFNLSHSLALMMYIKNFVSLPCFGMWRIGDLMMTQIMWCGWAAAVEQMRLGSETFVLQVMRILIPAMVVTALMLMVLSRICFDLNLVTIWHTEFENMCRYG